MTATLHLAKIAGGIFIATLGNSSPEQWSNWKLDLFLTTHGYSDEEASAIVEEAERGATLDVQVPESKAVLN
jgi:hypothetical protein